MNPEIAVTDETDPVEAGVVTTKLSPDDNPPDAGVVNPTNQLLVTPATRVDGVKFTAV